jgi:uncharacterized membrane protein YeaQ/YmgE (transglycosylase-associated protein family)
MSSAGRKVGAPWNVADSERNQRLLYKSEHPGRRASGIVRSMSILWMIVIGLVIGALAKLLMPGRDPGGPVITMLLGIAGSIVAGFIGRSAGWYAEGEPAGFIASVLGSVLLLALFRAITSRGGSGRDGIGRAA